MQDLTGVNTWTEEGLALYESVKAKYGNNVTALRFINLDKEGEYVYAFLKPLDAIFQIKLIDCFHAGNANLTAFNAVGPLLYEESSLSIINGANPSYKFGIAKYILDSIQIAIPDVKKN